MSGLLLSGTIVFCSTEFTRRVVAPKSCPGGVPDYGCRKWVLGAVAASRAECFGYSVSLAMTPLYSFYRRWASVSVRG